MNGQNIYLDDEDRLSFLRRLERAREKAQARVLAYCLMGNHFHLVLKVSATPLSAVMQRLLTGYASEFNERYGRQGHLFQARYKANLCLDDRYLVTLIRYVHLNPVRNGLVSHPADWRWSSYREFKGRGQDGLIHSMDDLPPLDGDVPPDFDPWQVREKGSEALLSRGPTSERNLEDLVASIAATSGVDLDDLKSRSRRAPFLAARRSCIAAALAAGHGTGEIATALRVSLSTISRVLDEKCKVCKD